MTTMADLHNNETPCTCGHTAHWHHPFAYKHEVACLKEDCGCVYFAAKEDIVCDCFHCIARPKRKA